MPSVAARERGREVPKAQANLPQVTQSPALVTGWCDKILCQKQLTEDMAPSGQGSIMVGRHGGGEQKADPSHLQLQQESENEPEVHVQTLRASRL